MISRTLGMKHPQSVTEYGSLNVLSDLQSLHRQACEPSLIWSSSTSPLFSVGSKPGHLMPPVFGMGPHWMGFLEGTLFSPFCRQLLRGQGILGCTGLGRRVSRDWDWRSLAPIMFNSVTRSISGPTTDLCSLRHSLTTAHKLKLNWYTQFLQVIPNW